MTPQPHGEQLESYAHTEEIKRLNWLHPKYSVQIGNFVLYITDSKAEAAGYEGAVNQCIQTLITRERQASRTAVVKTARYSCPCELIEPCSTACTCSNSIMSGGCQRCCKYGSMSQRIAMAERLAQLSTEATK